MTVWILASLLSLAVLLLLFLPLFRRTPPLRGHKASDGVEVSETRSDDAAKPANFLIAVSLVVLVPVFSFTVYGWLGKPSLPGLPYAERRSTHEVDPSSLHALVENLAQRMREGQDLLEGWQLLGRYSKQLKN
ncbi:MAG: hypothetical protein VYE18_08360 [Pseudomonadota bacterium]|nr:hypothetical protein [Pseudomonadota bacterium]